MTEHTHIPEGDVGFLCDALHFLLTLTGRIFNVHFYGQSDQGYLGLTDGLKMEGAVTRNKATRENNIPLFQVQLKCHYFHAAFPEYQTAGALTTLAFPALCLRSGKAWGFCKVPPLTCSGNTHWTLICIKPRVGS